MTAPEIPPVVALVGRLPGRLPGLLGNSDQLSVKSGEGLAEARASHALPADLALRGRWFRERGDSLLAVPALVGLVELRLYDGLGPDGKGTWLNASMLDPWR